MLCVYVQPKTLKITFLLQYHVCTITVLLDGKLTGQSLATKFVNFKHKKSHEFCG